jgi:leucine dehydrogenase
VRVPDDNSEATARCAERFGAEVVTNDKIHAVDADVFSPNALGGVVNDQTLPELACRIVAGAANNQLLEERHADALAEAGILYAPDYVINAGGVIQVGDELHPDGFSADRARARTEQIGARLLEIFAMASERGVSTETAAEVVAEQRMASVGRLRGFYLPTG